MAAFYDPRYPKYKRCDSCGRNEWKVAVRFENVKPGVHPTDGYCTSCFEHRMLDDHYRNFPLTGTVVVDRRGTASKNRCPVPEANKPQPLPEPDELRNGRRVWTRCGHPAERDALDGCYTCQRPLRPMRRN